MTNKLITEELMYAKVANLEINLQDFLDWCTERHTESFNEGYAEAVKDENYV